MFVYHMTPGIEYALGAMLLFGIGDLVYKRGAAAGAQPHHFLMVQSWVFTPTVALYGLVTGSLTFVAGTLWGGLAALFTIERVKRRCPGSVARAGPFGRV